MIKRGTAWASIEAAPFVSDMPRTGLSEPGLQCRNPESPNDRMIGLWSVQTSLRLVACLIAALIAMLSVGSPLADESQSEYLMVEGSDGTPLNVLVKGPEAAPAILFIHGIGQSHLSWEEQFRSDLADTYRLVAFDLRGHGNSGKPVSAQSYDNTRIWADDVAAIVERVGIERPIIVAWSYGGAVAVDYVRHYGAQNVAGLNLVGAYGGLIAQPAPNTEGDDFKIFSELRQKQYSSNIDDNIAASRGMVKWLTSKKMPQAWQDRATMIGLMLPSYARRAMWKHPMNNQDLLDQMDMPLLLSVGAQDLGTPVDVGRTLAAEAANGKLSVYEESGHSPFVEDPKRFNAELRDFAKTVFPAN